MKLISISIILVFVIGWIMNLVKIFGMLSGDITAMFVFRIVGIFIAPLGGIVGWI